MFEVLILIIIFLYIANRGWVFGFIETITKEKSQTTDLTNKELLNLIHKKTGLKLSKIKLSETNQFWGMMGGIPAKPDMIISQEAYQDFNKDELEWLLLHEAGHYVLWHNVKIILLQLGWLAIGVTIVALLPNLFFAIIMGLILGSSYIQIVRSFEYEANNFALSKMDNPSGLNHLYEKAKNRWIKKGQPEKSLNQILLNIWILKIYQDLDAKIKN